MGWLERARRAFGLTETSRAADRVPAPAWQGTVTTFKAEDPVDYGTSTWTIASQVYAGAVTILHKTYRGRSGAKRLTVVDEPLLSAFNDALASVIRLGAALGKREAEVWDDVEWGVYYPAVSQS